MSIGDEYKADNSLNNFAKKRVVVMGLGRFDGGVAVARYLVTQHAQVLVTDLCTADQLTESLKQLEGLPIEYRLGEHCVEDFISADLIVVNPAVNPQNNPFLKVAKEAGVLLTSEIQLFVKALPKDVVVIGVTGSAGKSTVTAMVGHLLGKYASIHTQRRVWVGGNIGKSLLGELPKINSNHWIVLELSSFMLEKLDAERWSPQVAVVTNLFPNHLDRHGSMENYKQAKQVVLKYQTANDKAILGESVADWSTAGCKISITDESFNVGEFTLPGEHNKQNAKMALATCHAIGATCDISHLADFLGLPHRLQWVLTWQDIRYFNDSKCTTPDAAILAIKSFKPHTLHLILGGYDKKSDLSKLAIFAAKYCYAVYTLGQTGPQIAQAIKQYQASQNKIKKPCELIACEHLEQAIYATVSRVARGDTVLLSPGCASWDQFENYEQRGNCFASLALQVTGEGALPPAARR